MEIGLPALSFADALPEQRVNRLIQFRQIGPDVRDGGSVVAVHPRLQDADAPAYPEGCGAGNYTGGRYNEALGDAMQEMWVNFARCGDPSTDAYAWEPYTAERRMTMVLGEEIGMTEDLKREQRELIEPLLHHYFNGCYSQMKFMVPQLGRIAGHVLFVAALVGVMVVFAAKTIKRRKRNGKTSG